MGAKKSQGKRLHSSPASKIFVEAAVKYTGLPEKKIVDLLTAKFGPFDGDRTKEYMAFLKGEAGMSLNGNGHVPVSKEQAELDRTQALLTQMRRKVIDRRHDSDWDPCDVPGCSGKKSRGKDFRWVCTIGGLRHYLAVTLAFHAKITVEEALELLTRQAEEHVDEETQIQEEWKEGVALPIYEIQGWHVIKEEDPAQEVSALAGSND